MTKLGFWWQARNRHGVHSPFVYGFLDRTLYARRRRACTREQHLLLAACEHFTPKRVAVAASAAELGAWITPHLPDALWNAPPFDFYIAGCPCPELEAALTDRALWHNESVVFVGGLRGTPEARQGWKRLCALPQLRVILETYRAGLLFFRSQQAPQHFKIRLKSSIFRQ